MHIVPSLDFTNVGQLSDVTKVPGAPRPISPLGKFAQMLNKLYRNLATTVNGNLTFGDGSNLDNINGSWQNFTCPAAPNTDFVLTHNMGRIPSGYLIMQKDRAVDIYTGSAVATTTQITLRATVASAVVRMFILSLLLSVTSLFAQTTNVTFQVTDAGSQNWNNGTFSVSLVSLPGAYPYGPPFYNKGTTVLVPNQTNTGAINATGAFTLTLTQNTGISPSGSIWNVNVCAQALPVQCFTTTYTVTATTSTTITPSAISLNAQGYIPSVYSTSEISSASVGSTIYLIGSGLQSCSAVVGNTCTTWSGGGVPAINSPNLAIPGPPVFNVKNYGAKGSLKSSTNGSFINGNTTVTCTDCNFLTNSLAGDTICGSVIGNTNQCSTIQSITDNTHVVTSVAVSNQTNTGNLYWGTFAGTVGTASYDDAAVGAALAATVAATKLTNGGQNSVNKTQISVAAILYFPAGHYALCTQGLNDGLTNQGFVIQGDGTGNSIISWATNCTVGGSQAGAYWGSGGITWIHDISFDSMYSNINGTSFGTLLYLGGGSTILDRVVVCCTTGKAIYTQAQSIFNFVAPYGASGGGIFCVACQGEWRDTGASNNGSNTNVSISNVVGGFSSQGLKIYGGLVDECGTLTTGCTQVQNSTDVWFIGSSLYGTSGGKCLSVDANSYVHFNGGFCGSFGNDTNNSGPIVAAGGVLEASDLRMSSTGTGKCATINGTLINNGANTCESQFTIASGSESTNTVSLTVNTLGQNLNVDCAVGDTAVVVGVGTAGYNGKFKFAITAVGATTVSYTNPTSGLGAIGAGGTFSCLNNRSTLLTGTPTQTLAPSQFNCLIPTLTATTTTATTNCFFTPDRDIFVTRFSAGMGTAPVTCSPNAVLQISNGTNTQNLTISAAQNDSGALSSPVLLKAGTLVGVIVQTAAAGCGTSPANAAVNFYWMGGFDN